MSKIYLIVETECPAEDWDIQGEDGTPRPIAAYTTKDDAIRALNSWSLSVGAEPYPGGPEFARRVSDGDLATYRLISEVDLVK